MFRGNQLVLPLALAIGAAWVTAGAADDPPAPLTVEVEGGRAFTGLVDKKTDDRRLWLRFEEGTAVLWRPITWSRIVAASHRGQKVDLDKLQGLSRQIQSSRQIVVQPRAVQSPSPPTEHAPAPPASLAIEAELSNWDADVETDGLALWLRVLDADGAATVAAGSLEVELFAPRIRKYHEAPQSRGYAVDLIERWSVALTAEQFRRGEAIVRLPFGVIHPEFDRRADALGLVHARLAVPGQGVFEQAVDGVSIRRWSPTRDALLDNTGRGFLFTEGTGRGQVAYPQPRY